MKTWSVAVVLLALAFAVPALAEEEEVALTPEDGWQVASDVNLTLTQNA